MKFGRIVQFVLQVNTHRLTESDFYITSYFQDDDHDVRPPLAAVVAQRPPAVR